MYLAAWRHYCLKTSVKFIELSQGCNWSNLIATPSGKKRRSGKATGKEERCVVFVQTHTQYIFSPCQYQHQKSPYCFWGSRRGDMQTAGYVFHYSAYLFTVLNSSGLSIVKGSLFPPLATFSDYCSAMPSNLALCICEMCVFMWHQQPTSLLPAGLNCVKGLNVLWEIEMIEMVSRVIFTHFSYHLSIFE